MEIVVRPDRTAVCSLAARLIGDRLRGTPELVFGLATGRTMAEIYAQLVRMHREDGLDFSRATSFNLDEYIGLAPDDPRSYRAYMQAELFDHVNIDPARTHLPSGLATDTAAEGAAYEAAIARAGGIDLQLLGIGENGHIGFNEPGSSLASRTRDKTLSRHTRAQNAEMFGGDPDSVPARAMTMGVGTILAARELILVATGAAKAEALAKAVEGPLTAMVTASAIQLHPLALVIADEAAASRLVQRDYYDSVFDTEPQWAVYRSEKG